MEFRSPKTKKHTPIFSQPSLPLRKIPLIGIFDGLHVTIHDWDNMNYIYNQDYKDCILIRYNMIKRTFQKLRLYFSSCIIKGNFGKGSLSKGSPNYNVTKDDIPKIIFKHQYNNLTKWESQSLNFDNNVECKNHNLQLYCNSISKFLQSAAVSNEQISWKSWKKKMNKNVIKDSSEKANTSKSNNKNCIHLLEFTEGSNIEIDENFVKKVNKILELKKPVELSLPIQKFKEKVIVINFKSDLNADNISSSTSNATLETQPCLIKENLNLNLEESFFLNFALGCLKILDKNNLELSTNEVWQKFISAQANFLDRYIIYHYYRTKGWIVRSGLKYGGDFLLYKDGPTYNHASYLVKILNEKTELSWKEFLAINRLVETFNKDLLLCTVVHESSPSDEICILPDYLKNYSVKEVMSRRWIPSRGRSLGGDKF